jgi:2-oxoglutarate dehydrogenase E1 component
MYQAIKQRPPVHESYLEQLVRLGQMTTPQAEQASAAWRTLLEKELAFARSDTYAPARDSPSALWAGYHGGPENSGDDADTGVRKAQLAHLLRRMLAVPEGFHRHPRLQRFVTAREEMAEDKQPLDWSATEALALASLALEGVRVRLSGQDSARGTFSQRHAVLYDCENGTPFAPLQHLSPHQAPVEILNSPLSEGGVLGFEYGYSLDCPDGLVLWEAQYGDFVNAAQVIIDQFITSGEEKWRRLSGIVLLLPHGFEGQGPEHSSARIERFLQLAAEHNVQIAQPSTPAQYFHVLRRQARRTWRKPLILFSPKSLLRHPQSVSSLDELARGRFRRVIEDGHSAPGMVRRILLCAGKLYHDLAAARTELQRQDLAIVRLEQFYPLPMDAIEAALARYADETPACWVQEEPENMGAWSYLRGQFGDRLLGRFPFAGVCRPESASPATGSASAHKKEQTVLLERALLSSSS